MKNFVLLLPLAVFTGFGCHNKPAGKIMESVIAEGHACSLAKEAGGRLHLAFCRGDSMLYAFSNDHGESFSKTELISVFPELASSHARGPQVAAGEQGVCVIACNKTGNIFAFRKNGAGSWVKAGRVNDRDSAASEGLMSLAGDGHRLFAVWLDARDRYCKIYGSSSADGGDSWTKNDLIYASPDSMVCSCCRPSVALKNDQVYVMFRNLIAGNRDLYLIQSADAGKTFKQAEKLGVGSWKLNACPMDGGGLVIGENGLPQTVWRRDDKIFSCEPGKPENEISAGRSCSIATAGARNIYVWTEQGEVRCRLSAENIQDLGKGSLPLITAAGNDRQVVCVWENNNLLHRAVLNL